MLLFCSVSYCLTCRYCAHQNCVNGRTQRIYMKQHSKLGQLTDITSSFPNLEVIASKSLIGPFGIFRDYLLSNAGSVLLLHVLRTLLMASIYTGFASPSPVFSSFILALRITLLRTSDGSPGKRLLFSTSNSFSQLGSYVTLNRHSFKILIFACCHWRIYPRTVCAVLNLNRSTFSVSSILDPSFHKSFFHLCWHYFECICNSEVTFTDGCRNICDLGKAQPLLWEDIHVQSFVTDASLLVLTLALDRF